MDSENKTCSYSGLPSLSNYMEEKELETKTDKLFFNDMLTDHDLDRIIQMAWEDRTPFEAIEFQFGLKEKDVIALMRKYSLPSSFKMWRKRMASRKTKHANLRIKDVNRFKCSRQRNTGNKIAKR